MRRRPGASFAALAALLLTVAWWPGAAVESPIAQRALAVPDELAGAPARAVPTPVPVGLRIPAIELDAPLVRLGLDERGHLEVPRRFDVAGWYAGGPAPGQRGPAVVVGHVDSRDGPAVFHRLRELDPGDEVVVVRDDGTRARFVVRRSARHDKDAFPTAAVYGPTPGPELRLVTCIGPFDRRARSYRQNLVVSATLAAP